MSTIQIRIDEKTKKQASKIFDDIGIDMSTGIKMYLKKVIAVKGIPFDVQVSNDTELKDFHALSEKSFEFWNNKGDDIYQEVYEKKNGKI